MERLAAMAGVSRATLYRRFGSRTALVRRLIDEQGAPAQDLLPPDVHTRILQAARTIFGRLGFGAATMEQIAQEAGVGAATVYRHFGNKDSLIDAFIQAASPRRFLRHLGADHRGSMADDLTAFAATAVAFFYENRDLIRLAMFDKEDKGFLEQLRNSQGRTVTTLTHYLEIQLAAGNLQTGHLQNGSAANLALAFVSLLFGFGFIGPTFYDKPLADADQAARLATEIFLQGVLHTPKKPPNNCAEDT